MIVELNDDETRLLYNVLVEQAQEHCSYASTSEVAERLCKLATRFGRPVRELPKHNDCVSAKWTMAEPPNASALNTPPCKTR